MLSFQEVIAKLQEFWAKEGCLLQQSYDLETGAGTFNPETFFRCLGPEPYKVCNVEICKRPTDGRYGKNPNRLQKFHQFQVVVKPSPPNIQDLYLKSLEVIGFNLKLHDFRFVHDDWESPTQGAWGLGWEVWCDGMEITQFTYFQSVGGMEVKPVAAELAYGLERIAMFLQGVSNVYDIRYNDTLTYGEVFLQSEVESCQYNFEEANVAMWQEQFENAEKEALRLLEKNLPFPAYDFAIKASHAFNILDARSAISTTARVDLMHRIRNLSCLCAKTFVEKREEMEFPLLKEGEKPPQKQVSHPSPKKPVSPSSKDDFLLEIGSEELPAAFIPEAVIQLEKLVKETFSSKGLSYNTCKAYGSPRRLSVHMSGVPAGTPEEIVLKKGPQIDIAFNEKGDLTKQGLGFLSSVDHEPLSFEDLKEGKSEKLFIQEEKYLYAKVKKASNSAVELLEEALPKVIETLPFPKRMRWDDFSLSYARPIRWIIAMYGKEPIRFSFADVVSSNVTHGHSQMYNKPIKIPHPRKYISRLKRGKVYASHEERKTLIEKALDKIERKGEVRTVRREEVIAEVLHLSEYPHLALYDFEEKYLSLPEELLISEMIHHQRYFPLKKGNTLTNQFVVAVDKRPNETILKNNRAVLIARLSDGLFLYEQDLKNSIEEMNKELDNIVFHKDLGSMGAKLHRIESLAEQIAKILDESFPESAARLCKFDLTSQVVYEFPELQGIMGKYYALHHGESEKTAQAIEEHWWPLTEGSSIPTTVEGSIVGLADKLDNLMSYFNIGIKPTSSKDPYALRRAAIGALRIIIENKWSIDLSALLQNKDVLEFVRQRVKGVLADYGYKKEEIDAVLTLPLTDPYDIYCRTDALHQFRKLNNDFDKLMSVYKRVKGQIGKEKSTKTFDPNLLEESAEKVLAEALTNIKSKLEASIEQKDYLSSFQTLSTLSDPLAVFFDEVRVLADDPKLKDNRVALLQKVLEHTSTLVDFTNL